MRFKNWLLFVGEIQSVFEMDLTILSTHMKVYLIHEGKEWIY